ncbi:MAG: DUF4080 domain-containing protein [Bacteroidia bacterium]
MQVLLTTLNAKYIHTNLAIRLLYALNKDKHNLSWKEFTIRENPEHIIDKVLDYDIIAFSCYIWNITQTLELVKLVKSKKTEIKILLGGPEVSYEYEEIINLSYVDYIIREEGEIPFSDFLNNYPNIENVPGLVYKQSNGEIISKSLPPKFDLRLYEDVMPYQYDDVTTLKDKVLYIETSRGCPYKCEFCLASLDNKVRYLPDKHIKNTLLYLMEHGNTIKFLDRTFNIKRDFTLGIFDFILKHHKTGNVFQFEITADILHQDIINYINEKVPKNLFRFEIGIQTVNQAANLSVSRKQSFEKTKNIINQVRDKVELHLDLIVGLPLDYYADIKYSLEEVFKLFPPELQLGFLKLLKGTPVREKYLEHGFDYDPNPPYQLIKSNYLNQQEINSILDLEHMLEVYWNGKKAINTLKYITIHYSIFDFLLKLSDLFKQELNYYQFTLTESYDMLIRCSNEMYPNDSIVKEMIALDYYLHYKTRPKQMYVNELEKEEKKIFLNKFDFGNEKKRFIVLPVSFQLDKVFNANYEPNGKSNLVIAYNGVSKAELIIPKTTAPQH